MDKGKSVEAGFADAKGMVLYTYDKDTKASADHANTVATTKARIEQVEREAADLRSYIVMA